MVVGVDDFRMSGKFFPRPGDGALSWVGRKKGGTVTYSTPFVLASIIQFLTWRNSSQVYVKIWAIKVLRQDRFGGWGNNSFGKGGQHWRTTVFGT